MIKVRQQHHQQQKCFQKQKEKTSRVNKNAAKAAVRPAPNMLAMKAMKKKRPVLTEKKGCIGIV